MSKTLDWSTLCVFFRSGGVLSVGVVVYGFDFGGVADGRFNPRFAVLSDVAISDLLSFTSCTVVLMHEDCRRIVLRGAIGPPNSPPLDQNPVSSGLWGCTGGSHF